MNNNATKRNLPADFNIRNFKITSPDSWGTSPGYVMLSFESGYPDETLKALAALEVGQECKARWWIKKYTFTRIENIA